MFNWIKKVFVSKPINFEILPLDYCKDKSDQELIERLRKGFLSLGSGNMIVLELLERLIKKCNQI